VQIRLQTLFFAPEITKGIFLEAFGIFTQFTAVSENNEHFPYLSDTLSSKIGPN